MSILERVRLAPIFLPDIGITTKRRTILFRDLLVHVDGSEAARARVRLAIRLCLLSKARLNGIHVTPPADVPPVYKPSQIDAASEILEGRLSADAKAAAAVFQSETAGTSIKTTWSSVAGDIAHEVSLAARCNDLVIVGQYEWQGPATSHPLPVAHSVVTHCGRPLLIVPAAVSSDPMTSAIIAWDGSRECVRAVHDAIPLLHGMSSVQLVAVTSPDKVSDTADTTMLTEHLGRHDITVSLLPFVHTDESEHKALLRILIAAECDLLVMGGYSRPPWYEFLFGGATKSVLLHAKTTVLISH